MTDNQPIPVAQVMAAIDKIKDLDDAATKPPWRRWTFPKNKGIRLDDGGPMVVDRMHLSAQVNQNIALIVALRFIGPEMLDYVEKACLHTWLMATDGERDPGWSMTSDYTLYPVCRALVDWANAHHE